MLLHSLSSHPNQIALSGENPREDAMFPLHAARAAGTGEQSVDVFGVGGGRGSFIFEWANCVIFLIGLCQGRSYQRSYLKVRNGFTLLSVVQTNVAKGYVY